MTVNRTTLLDLPLPVTGTESGTWGDTTNNGLTQYLDIAIAGTLVLSTDADVTLTSTEGDSSATNIGATTAQYAILRWTATGSTTRNITALAQSKTYVVINATGGTQSIVLRGAGPTTGVTIISGEKALCVWNGSDFVKVSSSAAAGGSNTQVQYNSSGVLAGSSNLTFDGTSLTLGGNPTLSAGTANGVLYLNGSKVATSGSALTFDGTNLKLYKTATPVFAVYDDSSALRMVNAGGINYIQSGTSLSNSSAELQFGGMNGSSTWLKMADTYHIWNINSSEQMRLTSTGLGIGTSSPAYKLDVTGTSTTALTITGFTNNSSANNTTKTIGTVFRLADTVGFVKDVVYLTAYPDQANAVGGGLAFSTRTADANPTEKMRLDSSGNLGIGTSSPSSKLVVTQGAGAYQAIQIIASNSGEDAGIRLQGGTGKAFRIQQPAATAGLFFYDETNAATRMTIDSSGNLGLGVTPSAWGNFKALQISYMGIAAYSGGSGDASISWNAYNNGTNWIYGYTGGKAARYKLDEGTHSWYVTATNGTAGNAITFTQAMTLDASGNLGVGATSLSNKLTVIGSVYFSDATTTDVQITTASSLSTIGCATNTPLAFKTNNTERARITSGGELLVGTTSGSYHRFHKSSASDFAVQSANTSATTPYVHLLTFTAAAPNDATSMFLRCDDTGQTGRIQLRSNGGIANYSANDVNLSDRREKTNFAPASEYLSKICAIPVQTFNYIDQNMEDDPGLTLGVVAQDVQAVAPELVMESNWGTKENPKMRLSIYQTDLQYALMKCIQEQQALIESLTSRVAQLEGA